MKDYLYFISHSASDRDLAAIFCEFMQNAMGIPESRIFCSSVDDSIPFGTNDYLQYIRNAIIDTKKSGGSLVALITKAFMESDFCKYEIGASWILETPIRPIFFPPISCTDRNIQGSPLSKTQAAIINTDCLDDSSYRALIAIITDGTRNEAVKNICLLCQRESACFLCARAH